MEEDMETLMKTWKHRREHGDMDENMDTWTHGDYGHMETWTHGYMDTWRLWTLRRGHGDMDMGTWIWSHGHDTWKHWEILKFKEKIKLITENGIPGNFYSSVNRFLQTEFCCFLVC
jgi:hypothetical protein